MVFDSVVNTCKTNKLNSLEIPKKIFLSDEAFSVENGLITSTFKLKRNEAKNNFIKIIENLYKWITIIKFILIN